MTAAKVSAGDPEFTGPESAHPGSLGQLAAHVVKTLVEGDLNVAVAESLTGGLLTGALTSVPGSSSCVLGGVVAYTNRVKCELLGVEPELLAEVGPVSRVIAEQMASGIARVCGSDIGISTTGVAGPGSHNGVAAGVFWVGWAHDGVVGADRFHVAGDRDSVRKATVHSGLKAILRLCADVPDEQAAEIS